MNNFAKKMFDLNELEQYARRKSLINDLYPSLKIIVTLFYIVLVVSVGKYHLDKALMLGAYPIFLLIIVDVPFGNFASKMIIPLLLSVCLGSFNLFMDREVMLEVGSVAITGGLISFVTLFIKGMFTISATLLLVTTTTMTGLGKGMRSLGVPKLIVMLLLLMYRYISVLLSETDRTIQAYCLRAPQARGIHISSWGSLVGQIVIKSYKRSEEIYNAMCLRGYGTGDEL